MRSLFFLRGAAFDSFDFLPASLVILRLPAGSRTSNAGRIGSMRSVGFPLGAPFGGFDFLPASLVLLCLPDSRRTSKAGRIVIPQEVSD